MSDKRETEAVEYAITKCAKAAGPLLPMLHAIHDELGYVPELAVHRLADALNISRAEVHGTITFYHDFRSHPPGRHVLKVCRAEACQSMGVDALVDHVKAKLGCDFHETSKSGVTLEAVYCLGNCAIAPSVLLDGKLHGRVTKERFDELEKEMK